MLMKRKLKRITISFIMALVVFIGLLVLEKNALNKKPMVKVVKVVQDIERSLLLNSENLARYVEMDLMEEDKVPEGAFANLEDVSNHLSKRDIFKNEFLTSQNMLDESEITKDIENPVEVSVKVNDVSQLVGGVLREGDFVDVSLVSGATNQHVELLKGVMVVRAIHADGSPITREDKEKSAIIINLIMDKTEEIVLNQSINLGMIRLSKVVK